MDWQRLLIIQPSEIYGAGGTEGVDQLIRIGRRWHVVPMLFGSSGITFSPLHIKDFVAQTASAIAAAEDGLRVMTLSGPEDLSGAQIARRIAKRVGGIPIPVWWPLMAVLLKAGCGLGLGPVAPDQPQRLTCKKTCSAADATNAGEIRFLEN
jgi:nucleoside-diphosphate-sugar epimerase